VRRTPAQEEALPHAVVLAGFGDQPGVLGGLIPPYCARHR
jgi:hypothetical protein